MGEQNFEFSGAKKSKSFKNLKSRAARAREAAQTTGPKVGSLLHPENENVKTPPK